MQVVAREAHDHRAHQIIVEDPGGRGREGGNLLDYAHVAKMHIVFLSSSPAVGFG